MGLSVGNRILTKHSAILTQSMYMTH